MPRFVVPLAALSIFAVAPAPALAQRSTALDVVLIGGRVLDPETGLDAVRTVGIRDGRIVLISASTTIIRNVMANDAASTTSSRDVMSNVVTSTASERDEMPNVVARKATIRSEIANVGPETRNFGAMMSA